MKSIITELKKRFSPKGDHRLLLNKMKKVKEKYPESALVKNAISIMRKKIYTIQGADYVPAFLRSLLIDNSEQDNIVTVNGIKYDLGENRDVRMSFCYEYIDMFLADPHFFSYESIENDFRDLLLSFGIEGPYQVEPVLLKENDVVIDAGANMGMFSMFSAKYKKCQVYAFEPGNEAYSMLKRNLSLNQMEESVKAYLLALSDKESLVDLVIDTRGLAGSSIVEGMRESFGNNIEQIQCVSLDHWVVENNISKIDFIKADIEGAERLLLRGAKNVLQKFQPRLSICTYHLEDDPEVLEDIIKSINPKYVVMQGHKKLYAYVP